MASCEVTAAMKLGRLMDMAWAATAWVGERKLAEVREGVWLRIRSERAENGRNEVESVEVIERLPKE